MPNWITNTLDVYGHGDHQTDLRRLIDLMEGDGTVFDFGKVLPFPEALQGIRTGYLTDDDGRTWRYWREDDDGNHLPIEDNEVFQLIAEHGAASWYEWNNQNWGTKWNAKLPCLWHANGHARFSFDTAWSPPMPVLDALFARFTNLTGSLTWFDEGDTVVHRTSWRAGARGDKE